MRFGLPSPYREIPHTADVGVEVSGQSREEAVARAVLAMAQLITAGGDCPEVEQRVVAAHGDDAPTLLIDVLRQCVLPFFTDGLVPVSVETRSLTEWAWSGSAGYGRFVPERHPGADLKAVTYAEAALEEREHRWLARAVFDI